MKLNKLKVAAVSVLAIMLGTSTAANAEIGLSVPGDWNGDGIADLAQLETAGLAMYMAIVVAWTIEETGEMFPDSDGSLLLENQYCIQGTHNCFWSYEDLAATTSGLGDIYSPDEGWSYQVDAMTSTWTVTRTVDGVTTTISGRRYLN